MNKCKDLNASSNSYVDKYSDDIADKITIELHSSPYSTIAFTFSDLDLHQTGMVTLHGFSAIALSPTISGSYYITVKSRNHLETASASLVSFTGTIISYDFTNDVAKAYASTPFFTPTKLIDGKWMLYAGDVISDSNYPEINIGDVYSVFNSRTNLGYSAMDIDGSGDVTDNDVYLLFNNRDKLLYIP